MGTRADFYMGRGTGAEWLGSIAWDGDPPNVPMVSAGASPQDYRNAVLEFLASRDDATTPDLGWPWPWDDSRTSDFAYAHDAGNVWCSCFGSEWRPIAHWLDDTDGLLYDALSKMGDDAFPNMKAIKNVDYGKRSGLTVITIPRDADGRRIDP